MGSSAWQCPADDDGDEDVGWLPLRYLAAYSWDALSQRFLTRSVESHVLWEYAIFRGGSVKGNARSSTTNCRRRLARTSGRVPMGAVSVLRT